MLMSPDQQQNLLLLHDESARHSLRQPAQHHQSWEHLMQTSRAVYTANSRYSFLSKCRFELGCVCVVPEP